VGPTGGMDRISAPGGRSVSTLCGGRDVLRVSDASHAAAAVVVEFVSGRGRGFTAVLLIGMLLRTDSSTS
jgi:hypothetical protein